MSDNIKLVIEIPAETYEYWKTHRNEYVLAEAIKNGISLDDVKAEIKEKCDGINYIVSDLPYPKHRAIQELLCEILDNIGKAENEVNQNETDN